MGNQDHIDLSAFADDEADDTELLEEHPAPQIGRFRVAVTSGPGRDVSKAAEGEVLTIGSHPSNDLVVDDPAVSRFHCELRMKARDVWLTDLESSNGTSVNGIRVGRVALPRGANISIGRSTLVFALQRGRVAKTLSSSDRCGRLIGTSTAMRATFALLERAARSDVTVLLEGETGTGKEGAAEAIHSLGPRTNQPLLVVNCGAVPATLLESELFGHEKGAFTGADEPKTGFFEEADGGTVFLDEIGELPLELQPKLLRVLEQRTIRPLGATFERSVDVRIVAATNRDLREEVNRGTFRSDLYYRLAVLKITLPPLRARQEDISPLVAHFLDELAVDPPTRRALMAPETIARMQHAPWPGNVRELRNYVERCAIMQEALPPRDDPGATANKDFAVDADLPYSVAKRRILDVFERRYLEALMTSHAGNVSKAARAAGMDRVYVHRMLKRHGLGRPGRNR